MVSVESCCVIGDRGRMKLEKELDAEKGEYECSADAPGASCIALHVMGNCMRDKASRRYG